MKRRSMLAGLGLLPWLKVIPEAMAAALPYRVSLIGGEFLGGTWQAGVRVDLDEGWETYWRNPGDAGIPPEFDWSRSEGVEKVEVSYPVPTRFRILDAEAIGYRRQVVFPVMVKLADAATTRLALDLFFAVCKDVCIPATAKAELMPSSASSVDSALVAQWMKRVPVQGVAVASASMVMDGGTSALVLKLTQPASDIFVESASAAYFAAPIFSAGGGEARLAVTGLKDPAGLRGAVLKLTIAHAGSGIEQEVTVE